MGNEKRKIAILLSLAFAIFLTFLPSLSAPFHLEDKKVLLSTPATHDLFKIEGITLSLSRPLFYLSLVLDWRLWGNNPFWFRLTNLILHIAVALLLFDVLRRLFTTTWVFPALASALFALHPTMTESVFYLSGRSDVLSALFCLLSLDLYLILRKGEKVKLVLYSLSLISFVLAVLAKETALTLPLLLLAFEWLKGEEDKKSRFSLTLPFFIVVAIISATLLLSTKAHFGFPNYREHIYYQSAILARYLFVAIIPINLTIGHIVLTSWQALGISIPSLFLSFVVFLTFYLVGKSKARLGFLWVLIALTTSLLIPLKDQPTDKNLYFATMGIGLVIASGFERAFEINRKTAWGLVTTMVICFATAIAHRNSLWSSEERLWRDAIRKLPEGATAYNHLCALMMEKGELDKAWRLLEMALLEAPNDAQTHYQRGVILAKRGDWELASSEFATARELNPDMTDAFLAQAEMEVKLRREENARQLLETVLKREPDSLKAILLLAEIAMRQGSYDESESLFKRALALDPHNYDATLGMGLLSAQRNNFEESRKWLKQAVELDPSRPEAHEALGKVSANTGDWNEAIARLTKAIESSPEDAELYGELGKAYMKIKNWEEARKAFIKQMQLKPTDPEPLLRLAELEEARGNTRDAIRLYNRALMLDKKGRYKATLQQILKKLKEEKKELPL